MRHYKLKALSIGAFLTSTFALSPMVSAEESSTVQSTVDSIDQEISQLQATSSVLNQEIDQLNNEILQNQELLSIHQEEINTLESELANLEEEIDALEDQLAKRGEKLAEQARTLQKNGPLNYIQYILDADSLSLTINRINLVSDVIAANEDNLEQQKQDQEKLAEKQKLAEDIKEEQVLQLAALEDYNATLNSQREERQVLVAEVADQANHKLAERDQVIAQAEAEAEAAAIAQAEAEAAQAAEEAAQAQVEAEAEAAQAEAEALAQKEAEAAQAQSEAEAVQATEEAAQAEMTQQEDDNKQAQQEAVDQAEAADVQEAEETAQAEVESSQAEEIAQAEAETAQAEAEALAQKEAEAAQAAEKAAQAEAARKEAQAQAEAEAAAQAEKEQAINVEVKPVQAAQEQANSSQLHWPADARRITSVYGNRTHPIYGGTNFHSGVDIAGGGRILAAESGTVTQVGWAGSYGNRLVIDHGNGFSTLYAHLAGFNVSVGQTVSRGQHIATMGTTGASTGVHLHFETRVNGQTRNPLNYIN